MIHNNAIFAKYLLNKKINEGITLFNFDCDLPHLYTKALIILQFYSLNKLYMQ